MTEKNTSAYVLAALVVLLALALGYAKGAADMRSESRHRLIEAQRRVREADADLGRVEAAVRRGPDRRGGQAARDAHDSLLAGRRRLGEALDLVASAEAGARASADRRLAAVLRQAVRARLDMLDSASVLLPLQVRASDALRDAEAGWSSAQRAALLSDAAAKAFNTHTRAGVGSSTALTLRAESELASGEAALREAFRSMPEAPLEPALGLLAARRGAAEKSRRIDAAWLSGKVTETNALLAELADEQTRLAVGRPPMPEPIGDSVVMAYRRLAAESLAAYESAARSAERADAMVRQLAAQPSE